MTLKRKLIPIAVIALVIATCSSCVPVYSPLLNFYVPYPLPMLVSDKLREARDHRKTTLQKPVFQAIKADDVTEFLKAWKACKSYCENPEFDNFGTVDAPWIKTSIRENAWHVLAYQLSQASPQLRQRLLQIAGRTGYDGSEKLITALMDSGARADGVALANAVQFCRAGMVELLLDRGAPPLGKYGVDVGWRIPSEAQFSLLSLAHMSHCDAGIRGKLIARGVDSDDIDPVLRTMHEAIAADNPIAYEEAWGTCAKLTSCTYRGSNLPLNVPNQGGESGWLNEAIVVGAWRVVTTQIGRLPRWDLDRLWQIGPACYPDRPQLLPLLRAHGAKANHVSSDSCVRYIPGDGI